MLNTEIRQLYNLNKEVPPTQENRFKNPFYLPTNNQLLYSILQSGALDEPEQPSPLTTKTIKIKSNTEKSSKTSLDVYNAEGVLIQTGDPSFNPTANYYQSEVYKDIDDRKLFKEGDMVLNYLSDKRHMVIYNKPNNNLYVAYRGTDPQSFEDLVSDINIAYQYEKELFNEYTERNPSISKIAKFFGSALGGLFAPELVTESTALQEAFELVKSGNELSEQFNKLDYEYHKNNINYILESLPKYISNPNLILLGHSKGGAHAQLIMEYLKGNLSEKGKYKPKSIKTYTYNSLPYISTKNDVDRDYYPSRTDTDIANPSDSRNHPHLRIITRDKQGNKFKDASIFTPLYSHRAEHFVNRDYRKYPMLINKNKLKIKK